MSWQLEGRVAMLTGASRGIGRSTALALADAGVDLALLARSDDDLADVAAEVCSRGVRALPLSCDVSDDQEIEAAVDACYQEFGGIDCLVNNAGAFLESSVEDIRLEDWEYTFRVNSTAPFLFCQAVLPVLKERGGGKIVNVASTSATKGYLYQSAYCASKHALLGFSRCLALECKPHHIHVTTLCPGGVRTDFIAGTYLGDRLEGQAMIEPEDVAKMVVFVLSQPDNLDIPEVVMQRCHVE